MSCLPSDQMPFDQSEGGRAVVLYPSCSVGVYRDAREVAVVLDHADGRDHLSPALLLNEKEVAQLILQLQNGLQFVRQLPVAPYIPQD